MELKYNPNEWTPCPKDCAYCHDSFYGHPKPHPDQKKINDGKLPIQIKDSKLKKILTEK